MEISSTWMVWVNVLLIVGFILMIYIGYKTGLLLQLFSLLSMIVKLVLAWMFSPILARVFVFYEPDLGVLENSALDDLITQNINTIIWFVVLYLVLSIAFLFLKPLIKGVGKLPIIKTFNQLAGMLFGAIKFFIYTIILIFLLQTPLFANGEEVIEQTWLDPINQSAPVVFNTLSQWASSNPAISRLLAGELLSDEDVDAIEQWLIEQEIDSETIQDILERLPTSDE
jgi:uncharacterized membrane protein required for colicin V production